MSTKLEQFRSFLKAKGYEGRWSEDDLALSLTEGGGYVFAQDPAMDNVMVDGHSKPISELGSLHVPGRVMIPEEEFVQAWHDEDEHGRPFVRFGVAVGPRVVVNCNPSQMRGADGRCGPGIGLDIPREDMPQIRKDDMEDFLEFCRDNDVSVTKGTTPASKLKPTQGEFRQERVDALPDEALKYTVLVSEDDYVLDGTHRWIKHWQKDKESGVPILRLGLPVREAIDLMRRFPKAQFVDNAGPEDEARDQAGRWTRSKLHSGEHYLGLDKLRQAANSMELVPFMQKYSSENTNNHLEYGVSPPDWIHDRIPLSRLEPSEYASWTDMFSRDFKGLSDEHTFKPFLDNLVRLLKKGKELKPVYVEGNIVVDGHHRFLAYRLAGRKTIPVVYTADSLIRLWKSLHPENRDSSKKLFEDYHRTIKPVENTRWAFHTSTAKLAAFSRWLKTRVAHLISGQSMREAWKKYVEQGWKKGAARAFDDTHQRQKWERHPDTIGKGLYQGGREEFLRSSFNHPESIEKVKLLASRTFTDLDGVTTAMSTKMTRTLADGLTMGQHPYEIAASLAKDVDSIGRRRAILIARTEFIRAHAEGQLDNLERLGVAEVGVAVEFTVTPDNKVCPKCAALQGIVLKTREAHGIVPMHPECRCAWIPSFDPPSSPEEVEAAVHDGILNADVSGEARDDMGRWTRDIAVYRGGELKSSIDSSTGIPVMYCTDSLENAAGYSRGLGDVHKLTITPKKPLVVHCKGRSWLHFVDNIRVAKINGNDVVIFKDVGDNADPEDDRLTTSYAILDTSVVRAGQ